MRNIRTYIYVDGFNLYYGAVKKTGHKWLDIKALFEKLLSSQNQIIAIKYFTAMVNARGDPDRPNRQQTYYRALEAYLPEVSIHKGYFLTHEVTARLVQPLYGNDSALVYKTEEKESDVNLALHLLNDAWKDKYDCAVLVSNDGDFSEALRLVREQHQKMIGLITPSDKWHPSDNLSKYAIFRKRIRKGVLAASQLPNPIPNTNIHKPPSW